MNTIGRCRYRMMGLVALGFLCIPSAAFAQAGNGDFDSDMDVDGDDFANWGA